MIEVPKLIYTDNGLVCRLEGSSDTKGVYRYEVINGLYDIYVNIPKMKVTHYYYQKEKILVDANVIYTGPFPCRFDYTSMIEHARAALADPSVNDKYKTKYVNKPKTVNKTTEGNEDYYILKGEWRGREVFYGAFGYEGVEWDPDVTPSKLSDISDVRFTLKSEMKENPHIKNIKCIHVKRKTTTITETVTQEVEI